MSIWKNVTPHTLVCHTNGTHPDGRKTVAPGGLLILDDRHDYLVNSEFGPGQVEGPIDPTTLTTTSPPIDPTSQPPATGGEDEGEGDKGAGTEPTKPAKTSKA